MLTYESLNKMIELDKLLKYIYIHIFLFICCCCLIVLEHLCVILIHRIDRTGEEKHSSDIKHWKLFVSGTILNFQREREKKKKSPVRLRIELTLTADCLISFKYQSDD